MTLCPQITPNHLNMVLQERLGRRNTLAERNCVRHAPYEQAIS